MKKPLTIGRVARTLLKFYEKYGWTQGTGARAAGKPVSVRSPKADSFCLLGASQRLTLCLAPKYGVNQTYRAWDKAVDLLDEALGSVPFFNDNNTQEVVFEKLRELARLP